MKEKILYVILGILIGAVITSAIFLIIKNTSQQGGMNGGGQMPDFSEMSDDMMSRPDGDGNTVGRPDGDTNSVPADSTQTSTNTAE